jgi:diguanylate cyclase (GGDEF)-like protein
VRTSSTAGGSGRTAQLVDRSTRAPAGVRPGTGPGAADDLGVTDVLVFARSGGPFRLVGGVGRGAGWAGIVEAAESGEPLLDRAEASGMPVRSTAGVSTRIAGPYWSRHAIVVPVGDEHMVVFGSQQPLLGSDAAFVRAAAEAVAGTAGVSPAKLLADELELVHAVRNLMDYRPETVRDTARHIAAVTARSLSCEVGAAIIRDGADVVMAGVDLERPDDAGTGLAIGGIDRLIEGLAAGPILEQEPPFSDGPLGEGIVARLSLPIGPRGERGVLSVGHATVRPRGFTLLCQRIGRALADAADLLISQALAREALSLEREQLLRLATTDSLTGVPNRAAWEDAIAHESARIERFPHPAVIVSIDIDELKAINDERGHAAGDDLIRAVADLLRSTVREVDRMARVGGDEFMVLLPETDAAGARRFIARLRRLSRGRLVPGLGVPLQLSVGWAALPDAPDLATAIAMADRRMYRHKRRRAAFRRSAGQAA